MLLASRRKRGAHVVVSEPVSGASYLLKVSPSKKHFHHFSCEEQLEISVFLFEILDCGYRILVFLFSPPFLYPTRVCVISICLGAGQEGSDESWMRIEPIELCQFPVTSKTVISNGPEKPQLDFTRPWLGGTDSSGIFRLPQGPCQQKGYDPNKAQLSTWRTFGCSWFGIQLLQPWGGRSHPDFLIRLIKST